MPEQKEKLRRAIVSLAFEECSTERKQELKGHTMKQRVLDKIIKLGIRYKHVFKRYKWSEKLARKIYYLLITKLAK